MFWNSIIDLASEEEDGMAEQIDGCVQVGKIGGYLALMEDVMSEIKNFRCILLVVLSKH
jgi:hypothetical protein